MQNAEDLTQEQIEEFLRGSQGIAFRARAGPSGTSLCNEFGGSRICRARQKAAGHDPRLLSKVTRLSLAQTTRLIRQYRQAGVVEAAPYRRRRFPVKYTARDIAVLAEVDRAHEWLSGPATLHILQREYEQFGRADCARLAEISVAHLYNLRCSVSYRKLSAQWGQRGPAPSGSGSGASQIRKDSRAICEWTRCIKAIGRASRVCITSMPWMP
jgi:hypothetical protein